MSKPNKSAEPYRYFPESGQFQCNRCGMIFGSGHDGAEDPDIEKEFHEAICDEVAEANERMRDIPREPWPWIEGWS